MIEPFRLRRGHPTSGLFGVFSMLGVNELLKQKSHALSTVNKSLCSLTPLQTDGGAPRAHGLQAV